MKDMSVQKFLVQILLDRTLPTFHHLNETADFCPNAYTACQPALRKILALT